MNTQKTGKKATILIVEDDVETAKVIGILLERNGYSVLVVHSGKEALAVLGSDLSKRKFR